MKIAILGATGWIGGHIVTQAHKRGHQVIALSRSSDTLSPQQVDVHHFDLLNPQHNLADALSAVDVVISAIGGRREDNHEIVTQTASRLLNELPAIGIKRLLWVGGAGSLEVQPGVTLVSLKDFPAEYKAEADVMSKALTIFRQSNSPLDWTFISPAADIFPGDAQSDYRIGTDQLLCDEQGNSRISVTDYAIAFIDELEQHRYPKQRIAVAY